MLFHPRFWSVFALLSLLLGVGIVTAAPIVGGIDKTNQPYTPLQSPNRTFEINSPGDILDSFHTGFAERLFRTRLTYAASQRRCA